MTGWKSMETAPKTGEEVLGYRRETTVCGVVHHRVLIRWVKNEHTRFEEAEGGLFKKVSVDLGSWKTGSGFSEKAFAPDRWMPLPPIPSEGV